MNQNDERSYRKAEKDIAKFKAKETIAKTLELSLNELESILGDVETVQKKDLKKLITIISKIESLKFSILKNK